ncbi:hypothetical protein NP493_1303g00033 [Ridgeia piscesae]|uniref:Protein kinase domain-containing protein n=1 Tax=Ridgeia piscesae TaxID=27915 RepID=A0AAD9K8L8_RIDPI|nr:hypothetical protein NP493_1303g00033 [Ridgeia piscesae]
MSSPGNVYWVAQSEKVKKFDATYIRGRLLGEGSTCKVYECRQRGSDSRWAVKIMEKKTQSSTSFALAEIGTLLNLNHTNVIRMKEVFETESQLHIVLELVTGGELFERIVTIGSYTEKDAAFCVRHILEGLKYLHDNDIVHRDLKPENLLYKDESENSVLKIADFGLATISNNHVLLQTVCGTPGYCAPEVLKSTSYGKAVDIWAVGVIIYILLCGYEPFYDENQSKLFKKILKCDYVFHKDCWSDISENAKDLISRMLVLNPAKRLTAGQALKHRWVQGSGAKSDNLTDTVTKIKEFNGRRKLKGVVNAVMAFQISKLSMLTNPSSDHQETAEVGTAQ